MLTHGNVEYINKGDLTLTKEKEKFIKFLERYKLDIYSISTT